MTKNTVNSINTTQTLSLLALVGVMLAGEVSAQAPLLRQVDTSALKDPPLPPACAADGVCYPNRPTFGYYGTRWRQWPEAGAAAPADRGATAAGLDPVEEVRPEDEDREAPPPSAERTEQESGGASTTDLPALPPLLTPQRDAGDADEGRDSGPSLPFDRGLDLDFDDGPLPELPPLPATAPLGDQQSSNRPSAVNPFLQVSAPRAARRLPMPEPPVRQAVNVDTPPPFPAPLSGLRVDPAVRRTGASVPAPRRGVSRSFYESSAPPPFSLGGN